MSFRLAPTIRPGLANLAGPTPKSKALVERLLDEDRLKHHCYFNKVGLHNHLSHHLLSAYDLGAPAAVLQAIYDEDSKKQRPIDLREPNDSLPKPDPLEITTRNWSLFVGKQEHYASYLAFFSSQVATHGARKTIGDYVFSDAANKVGVDMLERFAGGAFHPLIQVGYGAEFGSDAIIAQGLAQTTSSQPVAPEFRPLEEAGTSPAISDHLGYSKKPESLLSVLRRAYDDPDLTPAMPYEPSALLSARRRRALEGNRRAAIRRVATLWFGDYSQTAQGPEALDNGFQTKIEELFWVATLLLAGTSKPDRKPRLDFFLMHVLNSTLFLPSILALLTVEQKVRLLQTLLQVIMMYLLMRGRPRINPELIMSYTDTPAPPGPAPQAGDKAMAPGAENPWPAIVASALHAPDAHTVKAIRALYYAAQKYGTTPPGSVPGAFFPENKDGAVVETHEGSGRLDGTVFVRAAGVVMDVLGWVTHGQPEGKWDFSALGWEDAWKE